MSEVKSWLTENKLQLNDRKTEAMLVTSRRASTADSVPTLLPVYLSEIKFASQLKTFALPLTAISLCTSMSEMSAHLPT